MQSSTQSTKSKSAIKAPPQKAVGSKGKMVSKKTNPLFAMLKSDHRELEKLFARVRKNLQADTGAQKEFEQLKDFLLSHAKAEEQTVYSAVVAGGQRKGSRTEERTNDDIGEAKQEHHVAELLLSEISELKDTDPDFKAKVTVLCEAVAHHIEEEEESFSEWERILGSDLGEVAQEYRSRMDELLNQQ